MRLALVRLLLIALFTLLLTGTPVCGQEAGAATGAQEMTQADPSSATGQDPWGFEEDRAETWGDILRPQAVDLGLFAGFLALALIGFFRKSVRLKYVTLVIAVGYLGFVKSHLISVVNIFGLIERNLPIVRYNLTWYLILLFTVLSTVLWGRLYCGRVCAFGALTQLLDTIVPARLRVDLPSPIERRAALVKYGVLGVTVAYFLATRDMFVYRYVEPFWMFGFFATPGMWMALGTLLLASVFVRNLYCRFLCPLGATLGLLSNLTVLRIKRWSECGTCRICELTCEWGAIRGSRILVTECVRCDDCERVYLNKQKCPHWIIMRRRGSGVSPSAAPVALGRVGRLGEHGEAVLEP